MHLLATVLIAAIAVLHAWFVLLETVLFKTRGRRVFGLSAEKAEIMAPAMSNQGCYNGFLVAALLLGLLYPEPAVARAFAVYGLSCVAVAGIWGAATVKRSILVIQALPAVLAVALLLLA
jgi:putative membrane protein